MNNHTFALAATLLGAILVGLPSSASACSNQIDEHCTYPSPADGPIQSGGTVDCANFAPGSPSPGAVPMTEWYANSNAQALCFLAAAVQNGALRFAGSTGYTAGVLAVGATGLVDPDEPTPLNEYQQTVEARATFYVLSTASIVGPVAQASFTAASTALDTTCIYVSGQTPCI